MSSPTLDAIVSGFGCSVPIYKGTLDAEGTSIEFVLKEDYKPEPSTDPVEQLAVDLYRENFKHGEYKFENITQVSSVWHAIMQSLTKASLYYSELKNPRQSKLYKWLQSMDNQYNHPSAEAFVSLYRYASQNNLTDQRALKNSPHAKNLLAIMELMKNKYEDK